MITPEEARAQVESLKRSRGDYEIAHSMEDTLRHDVLEAIAAGSPHAVELASIALETSDIKFARYCA